MRTHIIVLSVLLSGVLSVSVVRFSTVSTHNITNTHNSSNHIHNSTSAITNNYPNIKLHNRTTVHQRHGCVNDPADIVFLVDRSGSVKIQNFRRGLNFIKDFAKHYTIGHNNVQIGVVTFANTVRKEIGLNQYSNRQALNTAMDRIQYDDVHGTHTSTALQYILDHSFNNKSGERPNVPNFLIVITDGRAGPLEFRPNKEAAQLHQTNIETFSIGIGNMNPSELRLIGTDDKHVYTVKDHLDLHIPLRHIRCEPFKTLPPTISTTPRTTSPSLKQCMGCKRIAEPHDCKEIITCAEHEQCSADFYITPQGHAFYDLGCRSNRVCDAISKFGKRDITNKRQDQNLYICQECCDTEHCNLYGCADKAMLNRTLCYNCVDVAHPGDCDVISVCDTDKKCFARHFITDMFEERWRLGCEEKQKCTDIAKYSMYAGHPKTKKQVIGGSDGFDLCYYCCDNNFCNKKDCEKGLSSSTQPLLSSMTTSAYNKHIEHSTSVSYAKADDSTTTAIGIKNGITSSIT
ncbi:matrilin-3-like [Mytilus edulis]|uniref:matrilin-3-like n=1 Tax=Mytilus edulis TaxID=6550 RepID=UPI0039F06C34